MSNTENIEENDLITLPPEVDQALKDVFDISSLLFLIIESYYRFSRPMMS